MKAERHNKPLIPQAWLRVLIFCVLYFALIVIAGVLVGLYQVASSANKTASTGIPYLSFIINAIISFAAVWLSRKFMDRQRFDSIGFTMDKHGAHAGAGFFLGIFLMVTGTCILFFSKNLIWTDISFNGNDLFIGFGLMVIVAFAEEIVFRGYILNNLLESANKWVAVLISAFIFALVHMANPNFSVVAAVNIFLAGILLGINYAYTKNLWFSILLHFAWNFMQGPILGYEVSGMQLQSLLSHEVKGNELLTGGHFGFEGSLVATVLLLLAIGVLVWVYEKKYTSWPVNPETLPA